jgi:hypothetical protein
MPTTPCTRPAVGHCLHPPTLLPTGYNGQDRCTAAPEAPRHRQILEIFCPAVRVKGKAYFGAQKSLGFFRTRIFQNVGLKTHVADNRWLELHGAIVLLSLSPFLQQSDFCSTKKQPSNFIGAVEKGSCNRQMATA